VNAPEPGTVKEYLVNEEDTVTVGQDLLKLELGGPPQGGEKEQGGQEPKAPASDEQSTSSHPEAKQDETKPDKGSSESSAPSPKESEPKKEPEPKKEESKPSAPPKKEPPPQEKPSKSQESRKPEPKATGGETAFGSREERRV